MLTMRIWVCAGLMLEEVSCRQAPGLEMGMLLHESSMGARCQEYNRWVAGGVGE